MSDPYSLEGPEPKEWLVAPQLQPQDLEIPDTPRIELKAMPGRCQEASMLSHEFYIPCNAPAESIVEHRGEGRYRMCAPCTHHNVRNRGATLIGPYTSDDQ